jgi:exonuclease III
MSRAVGISAIAGHVMRGLPLDHILLSPVVAERLIDAGVDRDIRGEKGASDHAPAWVRLADIRDET